MLTLSKRMEKAEPSSIMGISNKVSELRARGRRVINLSIGAPDFTPDAHVYESVAAALKSDHGGYGKNRGDPDLLDAFAGHLGDVGLTGYARENCVVGVGAKQLLYSLMEAILDEGDEVILVAPYWTSYKSIVEVCGGHVGVLPCVADNHYKLVPEQLEDALARKPKALIFNNPCNPTGAVYDEAEIAALAAVASRHHDTWIVTDDIYNRIIFDDIGYHHFLHKQPNLRDRVVIIDSVSKTYGMPGWRVGFLAGPPVIADAVVRLNSNNITSVPMLSSAGALAALTGSQDVARRNQAKFARRRDLVMQAMGSIAGVDCPRPQGTFYAFPDVSRFLGKTHKGRPIDSSTLLCEVLLEEYGVACVPGEGFGEPASMRICTTCPDEDLREGLGYIRELLEAL